MFGDVRVCRGLEYYVDVDSHSVIELGTFQHPYKDLDSVFVEILNLHAHTGRDINVYIKEETVNYLHISRNYILNIESIKIMTYSNAFRETNNKATIVSTDAIEVYPSYSIYTSFKILKTKELLIQEQITESEYISGRDQVTITDDISVFMVLNSSFTLLNIDIVSNYTSKLSRYYTVRGISMNEKLMNITNVDFNVSGYLMSITNNLNIIFQNSMIESTLLMGGIAVRARCNNLESGYNGTGMFDNLTFYYTDDRDATIPFEYPYFQYGAGGMITFSNINTSVYVPLQLSNFIFTFSEITSCRNTQASSSFYLSNVYNTINSRGQSNNLSISS